MHLFVHVIAWQVPFCISSGFFAAHGAIGCILGLFAERKRAGLLVAQARLSQVLQSKKVDRREAWNDRRHEGLPL